ncbi:MAG: putative ABC transport system ATP-binding protein [Alteromonadaceae bacterium]|jgi:putative ABC transport system ATP-binding protein
MEVKQEVVRLSHICRHFTLGDTQVHALKDINLSINKGEFLVLKGTSGSGKSTLLNLIGAMDEPSSGEVVVADYTLGQLNDNQKSQMRREHIGFIFQSFNLLPVLTALENVQYPLALRGEKKTKERAMLALTRVGLADYASHRPNQLSGGQMQRVAIARALVSDPDIILADEPTANLDSQTATTIMVLMKELNRQGVTFIFATHHEFVLQQATRVIELKDGMVIDDQQKAVAA